MKGLKDDLTHACRLYLSTPGASLIAILVLAVGLAFVTSFLSLYVDLVLRPHAGFEDSGRLVTLGQSDGERLQGLPFGLIELASDELSTLDALVGMISVAVRQQEETEPTFAEMVTRDFFGGLQPRLQAGRGFEPSEHDVEAEPVAVISYRYWQDELEGRVDVLDTTLELEFPPMIVTVGPEGQQPESEDDLTEFRIVGVMAPEVSGINRDDISVWVPLERAFPLIAIGPRARQLMTGFSVQAFGRRSDGASASSVVQEIGARYGESDEFNLQPDLRLEAVDGIVRNLNVQRESKRQLQLFLAGSVLMALVAAANVSLFLLARAPGRRRELSIRMSVGAPMKRLARQLASEAALLVVVSAVIGLVISVWLSGFLRGLAFLQQADWTRVTLFDWRVLGLIGAFLMILTLLVSLAPIFGLKRLGIAASSRQVAARATLAQRIAGTAQIAIAGMLGGAAVAFGWYLSSLMFGYPGYDIDNRYAVQYSYDPNSVDFADFAALMEAQVVEFARRREAIEAIPGVSGVSFGRPVPGARGQSWTQIPDPQDPSEGVRVNIGSVDSRYVDILGLNLLQGRVPDDGESNVALVNQAFARWYFGREDVVGESIQRNPTPDGIVEVIGVLEDLSFGHPSADVDPLLFTTQNGILFSATGIVESSLTAAALQQELEKIVESGAIEFRINNVMPLEDMRNDIIAPDRARGFLTIATATLVVLLAAFGFYGTQRYLVSAGRREYAIRASLGAGPKALGRLVFGRGLLLSVPGLVLGSFLAFILVAWLRDEYVSRDVSPGAVTVAVIAGLVLLLLAASLGPARQARRTQPAPLLKEE